MGRHQGTTSLFPAQSRESTEIMSPQRVTPSWSLHWQCLNNMVRGRAYNTTHVPLRWLCFLSHEPLLPDFRAGRRSEKRRLSGDILEERRWVCRGQAQWPIYLTVAKPAFVIWTREHLSLLWRNLALPRHSMRWKNVSCPTQPFTKALSQSWTVARDHFNCEVKWLAHTIVELSITENEIFFSYYLNMTKRIKKKKKTNLPVLEFKNKRAKQAIIRVQR